jgi:molybdopterin molybdotransferase
MIPLDQALEIIASSTIPVAGCEDRALADALNAVLILDITAPYNLPPFDNSAVDGFAFRHGDADGQKTAKFALAGEAMAGQPYSGSELTPKSAVRIATGGMVPSFYDTIAMQEVCRIEDGNVFIDNVPTINSSVRRAGNDMREGDIALAAPHRLRSQDVALAHALGLTHLSVRPRLRVAIASTGHELRTSGSSLETGQIIDTNGLMLQQLMHNRDVAVTLLPSLPDEYEATLNALRQASANHDLIITTGGISVGGRDFIRDAMHEHGIIHFWKTAIKPGRPVLFGHFERCSVAALPGNPVSAMVTFLLLGRPLLDALAGIPPMPPFGVLLPLATDINKEVHLRVFSRASLQKAETGNWQVAPYRDQSSNLISSLTKADGLLDLPLGIDRIAAGEPVMFLPFTGLLS